MKFPFVFSQNESDMEKLSLCMYELLLLLLLLLLGRRDGVLVKALYYKSEGRGFETL
jgi:hypothetical protein